MRFWHPRKSVASKKSTIQVKTIPPELFSTHQIKVGAKMSLCPLLAIRKSVTSKTSTHQLKTRPLELLSKQQKPNWSPNEIVSSPYNLSLCIQEHVASMAFHHSPQSWNIVMVSSRNDLSNIWNLNKSTIWKYILSRS
jgi:hypothetical protein